ncbi:MAG: AI-2E family transporter [Lachnospiraceae bacterium]|nr:AI-2E family transporter [Lachnospiraceae bacterium]
MKKLFSKLDPKYTKICVYACVTVVITVCLAAILLHTGGFWAKFWNILTAVLKPLIIGVVISYLFQPIVNKFESFFNKKQPHKWARGLSVLLTFLLVILVIVGIIVIICVTVYKNTSSISIESIQAMFVTFQNDYQDIWLFITDKLEAITSSPDKVTDTVTMVTEIVKNFFSGLIFGVIFAIYFMLDGKRITRYWGRAYRLMFGDKATEGLKLFLSDADRAFSGYIRGQFLDALIIGVVAMIVLQIAGIPNAVLVGLLVGIGNMIPYVGPVVGIVAVIVGCIPTAAIDKMIIGLIILVILMFIDGNVLNPKLLSNAISVHPLLVVAALIAGGAIGGVVGMIVAVPIAALIKVQFDRHLEKLEMEKEKDS